jgi:hypothetical protein
VCRPKKAQVVAAVRSSPATSHLPFEDTTNIPNLTIIMTSTQYKPFALKHFGQGVPIALAKLRHSLSPVYRTLHSVHDVIPFWAKSQRPRLSSSNFPVGLRLDTDFRSAQQIKRGAQFGDELIADSCGAGCYPTVAFGLLH